MHPGVIFVTCVALLSCVGFLILYSGRAFFHALPGLEPIVARGGWLVVGLYSGMGLLVGVVGLSRWWTRS